MDVETLDERAAEALALSRADPRYGDDDAAELFVSGRA